MNRVTRASLYSGSQNNPASRVFAVDYLTISRDVSGRRPYDSSSSPDEFSCYGKVSNATSLSIGLLLTLATSRSQIFSSSMLHICLRLTCISPSLLLHRKHDTHRADLRFLDGHCYVCMLELTVASESTWLSFGGVQGSTILFTW